LAEALFLVAAFAVPLAIGAATVLLSRPWWLGAIAGIAIVLVAAIAPEPEEGESRLVAGDLAFLFLVALVVAALTWLGAWLAHRLRGAGAAG
jgi:hypothetical protein